jgi:ABC-type sugar transport system ATPase subunit
MIRDKNNEIVIEAKGVSKYFPGVKALKDLDFEVFRGETHALVGENGAGKSTLMKTIFREYIEDEGDLFIEGKNIKDLGIGEVKALGLSLIHQELNLVDMFSVAHNICFGQEPLTRWGTIDWQAMRVKAAKYLHEVTRDIDLDMEVGQLSASQQQLVAIARALVSEPRFLILDEPTARLDHKASEEMFDFLARIKQKGLTIIYISHRLEEIYRISDRITVLRDGRKIVTATCEDLPQAEMVKRMVGRDLKEQVSKEKIPIGETLLTVKNLTPQTNARDINFQVRAGEILGLVGAIGAGKSEVARAIFGADRLQSGDITINNKKLSITKPGDAIKAGIALAPEERRRDGLIPSASLRKNWTLPSLSRLFRSVGFWINEKKEKEAVRAGVNSLNVATPGIEHMVRFLSGGTQQKVVIGKWLMSQASIYIFDEPTNGIDVGAKHEIYKLITDLARQGAGIIFISNELPEVLPLCDRILVLYKGRVIKELYTTQTDRHEVTYYLMGGKEYEKEATEQK